MISTTRAAGWTVTSGQNSSAGACSTPSRGTGPSSSRATPRRKETASASWGPSSSRTIREQPRHRDRKSRREGKAERKAAEEKRHQEQMAYMQKYGIAKRLPPSKKKNTAPTATPIFA